jgi:hypothetical protein
MMLKKGMLVLAAVLLFMPTACTQHRVKVDPIRTEHVVEVKPMTINVNVRVKVDRALEDYFGDIDAAREGLETE